MSDQEQKVTLNNKQIIKRIIWLDIALTIIIFDQISKWLVTELLFRPQITGQKGSGLIDWYMNTPDALPYSHIKITDFFNIVITWNTGISFSMFSNSGEYTPYILIFVAIGITVMFLSWLWKATTHIHGVCYALIIGGALGNVIDRSRFGAVIDFIDIHVLGYHWPAFNIADMAVVTGVSLLIIVSLFFEKKSKKEYR